MQTPSGTRRLRGTLSFRNDNIHFVVLREGLEARLRRVDDNIGRIYCVSNDEQATSAPLLPLLLHDQMQLGDLLSLISEALSGCTALLAGCMNLCQGEACVQVDIPDDVKCIDTTTGDELPKTSMGYLITWFDRYVLKLGDVVRGVSSCKTPASCLMHNCWHSAMLPVWDCR